MTFEAPPFEKEFVVENPVMLTNGFACMQSAFVELSPRCPGMFVLWFSELQAKGYIKIKAARVAAIREGEAKSN